MRERSSRYSSYILLFIALGSLLLLNCASPRLTTAADNYNLPKPLEIAESATGAWAEIRAFKRSSSIMGELLSVSEDSIHVLSKEGLSTIATTDVKKLVLYTFKAETGKAASIGLLGTLSTISHGNAIRISAPLWLLFTIGTASSVSKIPRMEYPKEATFEELHKFARFPTGIAKEVRHALDSNQQ